MAKAKKRPAKKRPSKKKPAGKTAKKAPAKKQSKKKAAKKPAKKIGKKTVKKAVSKKKTAPSKKAPVKQNKAWDKLIHPLSDRLVVRVEGPSEKTAGGLYIPGTVEERPNQGEVLACGPGSKSKKGTLKPLDVKVGDRVLFNAYAGVHAQLQGEEVLILREDEVLGILA